MGFNAGDEVEPLDYDFTFFKDKIPELAVAKGTIPEPSDTAVQRMQRKLVEATKKFVPSGAPGAPTTAAAMADLPEDAFEQAETVILDAIAELCAGSPTREQLAVLPYRHKRKFIAWLQRQLMNPEA
jgi:hypothetical protein